MLYKQGKLYFLIAHARLYNKVAGAFMKHLLRDAVESIPVKQFAKSLNGEGDIMGLINILFDHPVFLNHGLSRDAQQASLSQFIFSCTVSVLPPIVLLIYHTLALGRLGLVDDQYLLVATHCLTVLLCLIGFG